MGDRRPNQVKHSCARSCSRRKFSCESLRSSLATIPDKSVSAAAIWSRGRSVYLATFSAYFQPVPVALYSADHRIGLVTPLSDLGRAGVAGTTAIAYGSTLSSRKLPDLPGVLFHSARLTQLASVEHGSALNSATSRCPRRCRL